MSFGINRRQSAVAGTGLVASSPLRRLTLLCLLSLLIGISSAQASLYTFSYVGVSDPGIWGNGSFITGPAYSSGDGYVPILSITGITNAGAISGLVTSGGAATDPGNGNYLYCCAFDYDNSFSPGGATNGNWFSNTGGPLFSVTLHSNTLASNPINLFGDGNGNTYEFNYGQNTANFSTASYGGTLIDFTATDPTPEPGLYGALALGLTGLLFAGWRRHRRT